MTIFVGLICLANSLSFKPFGTMYIPGRMEGRLALLFSIGSLHDFVVERRKKKGEGRGAVLYNLKEIVAYVHNIYNFLYTDTGYPVSGQPDIRRPDIRYNPS